MPEVHLPALEEPEHFGDCVLLDTRLLGIYDEILPRLDRAIAD
jgi:hypothetical protein